jgi:hypothetical protein
LAATTFFLPAKDDDRLGVSVLLRSTTLLRLVVAIILRFPTKDEGWLVVLAIPAWTGIEVNAVPNIIVAKQILLAEKQNLTNR